MFWFNSRTKRIYDDLVWFVERTILYTGWFLNYILCRVKTAEKLAEASRGHWGIENSVHWSLDVTFHEDDIHIYDGYGAENLATVRKIALNALKQEKTRKLSLKNKRVLCAMNSEYLMRVLGCVVNEIE